MWQDAKPGSFLLDDCQRVLAGQPDVVVNGQREPLSVPRFPWYY
jgi:hypothetical protein